LVALIATAAWGALAVGGVFAQTFQQATATCSAGICQVFAPDEELTQGATLLVQPSFAPPLDPQSCQGTVGFGYSTQAISDSVPYSYSGELSGPNVCAFEVTSGVVPPGNPMGSFTLPYATYGSAVQLESLVCSDPTCGAAPADSYYASGAPTVTYTTPAYTPPVIYASPAYSPSVIYTQPTTTYTPPSSDNDSDGGQWQNWHSNGNGGQDQDQHWSGDNGQWQGSDPSNTQSNGSQADDPNEHHDDHGAGSQAGSGSSDPNQHHDDHGSSNQPASGTRGGGDPSQHHDDHGAGAPRAAGAGQAAATVETPVTISTMTAAPATKAG